MSRYLKYFSVPFIISVVIMVICIGMGVSGKSKLNTPRDNDYYDNTECVVYDFADKLTDDEEYEMTERIFYWQEQCHADILWITLDSPELGYLDSVKQYANEVTEEMNMGYDGPGTGAIVFVDNWSRGGDGKIHTWVATTGYETRENLTNDECDEILYILDEIPNDDADPYVQYMKILDRLGKEARLYSPFPWFIPFIAGLIAAALFIMFNWRSKLGDTTVTNTTYLSGGAAKFPVSNDVFNHKTVTKTKIESSSSSGGGGGSHGGGGHSR